MGNYHPHGDQAIYDALVRLAQDFALRYPLVDGQGNFGNIDGDNAAAMRYTESAPAPTWPPLLLDGIDEDTVDFRPTYDGERPGAGGPAGQLPQPAGQRLLGHRRRHGDQHPAAQRRGAVHRACCISSSIPTPTSTSWSRWCRGRTSRPAACIVEPREPILEAYKTGRGGFRLRARWEKEDTGRGTYQIVVTEIPYQVQKAKLVERIAELINDKKLPLLGDVRDELAETVRLVLEPKSRAVDPVAADGEPVQADRARGPLLAQHERARPAGRCRACCRCATC